MSTASLASHLEWKLVEETYDPDKPPKGYTYRAKVPGGWLVAVWAGKDESHGLGGGLTFVPDPTHGWSLTSRALP